MDTAMAPSTKESEPLMAKSPGRRDHHGLRVEVSLLPTVTTRYAGGTGGVQAVFIDVLEATHKTEKITCARLL